MDRNEFGIELKRFGPQSPQSTVSSNEAQLYCRQLALSHYENFSVVSRLLPRRLRQHFCNIYSYCRWADDLADEVEDCDESDRLLNWWRDELMACYQGQAQHPVFVALSKTINEFEIPDAPFHQLIDAFLQDQQKSRFETFDELTDYCSRSANPVGHLVLYLDKNYRDESIALSDCVCTGLQLANFWQDIDEDFQRGRVYIPSETLREFNCTEEWIRERRFDDRWRALMQYEVSRAEQMLRRGSPIVEQVSPALRWQVELFINGGLAILAKIRKAKYDVWSRRPIVGKLAKLRLLVSAWLRNRMITRSVKDD